MSKGITLEECAALLGISVPAAANRERDGSLPFVRITEKSGTFYTDPGNAIDLWKAGRATGYRDAEMTAQNATLAATDRKVKADLAEAHRIAVERADRDNAARAANNARYEAALEQASGMRTA